MSQGVLVLLGSGETAPGMTRVHREVLSRIENVRAVNLDTTYGFQLNVPQMSQKLEEYFDVSLQTPLETLHLPHFETSSPVERALFKQGVREATYVFAGPGSPTWALAQWRPLDLASDLAHVLDLGGTICFASAAALTTGAFTAPIYEIYKVGTANPTWAEGLDLTRAFGLSCVVIPHFDNAEGKNYDTRFCYLGEPRLRELEDQLPSDVATLGIDEHTAVIIDRESDTLTVRGRANAYWRTSGASRTLAKGQSIPLSELRQADSFRTSPARPAPTPSPADGSEVESPLDLARVVENGGDEAAAALAQLVRLAGTGGVGFIDPTPLVDGVIAARLRARAEGQYALADALRDLLVDAGVEVRDDPSGTTWSLRAP